MIRPKLQHALLVRKLITCIPFGKDLPIDLQGESQRGWIGIGGKKCAINHTYCVGRIHCEGIPELLQRLAGQGGAVAAKSPRTNTRVHHRTLQQPDASLFGQVNHHDVVGGPAGIIFAVKVHTGCAVDQDEIRWDSDWERRSLSCAG